MRTRYYMLAAGALAAGLTVLGTVGAQSLPAGSGTPKLPAPTYVPPADGAKPAGGYLPAPTPPKDTRPRLSSPVVAGADGVKPLSSAALPPPAMDIPAPGGTLPAPGLSPAPPSIPPLPAGVTPVPPAAPETKPAVSAPPSVPPVDVPLPPSGAAPASLPKLPGARTEASAPTTPVLPSAPGGIPTKSTQNVTIEAVCPETVSFGAEFRYELIIRNAGTSAVSGVRVEDEIPAGTKYVGSDPPAEMSAERLTWSIGALDAGAEKRITVRVKPVEEGELRSRATVTFSTAVDARTRVTRPRVAVAVTGMEVCKTGEEAVFNLRVNNSGTGPAQRLVVRAALSEGLTHPRGTELEMEIASLAAGETQSFPLRVSAAKAGVQTCQVSVSTEGNADTTAKASVNVVEPLLQISQNGPTKCLVRAEPSYEITLTNPGTATTDAIGLYAVLPEGFEFVHGSDAAAYSATNRAVVWKLGGLAPAATKVVTLKLRAAAAGDGQLRTIAQTMPEQKVMAAGGAAAPAKPAGRVLEAKTETAIKSEGVAAVRFEVLDLDDPVEVGKEAVYEVRVTNQGTGPCTNVQLVAAFADGTEFKGSSGPTQVKAQGQHLVFEPIATLAAKGEAVYRIKIRGSAAGDQRFRVQLTCDQVRTPVVKEESTRFYKQ